MSTRRVEQRPASIDLPSRVCEVLRAFTGIKIAKSNPEGTQHGKQVNDLHPPQQVYRQNIHRNYKFRVEESHRAVVWSWRARGGSGIVPIHFTITTRQQSAGRFHRSRRAHYLVNSPPLRLSCFFLLTPTPSHPLHSPHPLSPPLRLFLPNPPFTHHLRQKLEVIPGLLD
jgi:hypothetical protein